METEAERRTAEGTHRERRERLEWRVREMQMKNYREDPGRPPYPPDAPCG